MASSPANDLGRRLQDVGYVAVGLGVLAFQRAQVRRQELTRAVSRLGTTAEEQLRMVEERLDAVDEQLEAVAVGVEERLPGQVADLARSARLAIRGAATRSRDDQLPGG